MSLNTDDSDFDTNNKVVYLSTSDSRTCVNITVFEDDVYEGNEQFMVTFGSFSSAQDGVGLIEQSCVTIVDDESKSPILFIIIIFSIS